MRAAVRTGLLGRTISFTKDHPLPVPSIEDAKLEPTEVLIKVKSAAINPVDYKLPRAAAGKTVGIDVSGIVEKVGADVSELKVGDGVYGRAISSKGKMNGSLADYVLVNEGEIAAKSDYLTFDEAAAVPTAYLTGIQSLRTGNVKEGSTVLVIGASGGCGLAGIQLGKAMAGKDARVVGICSGKNFEFVRKMCGSSSDDLELVDYTDDDAMKKFKEENAGKFDCIYDTATGSGKGEDYTTTMPALLKEGTGQYVQINGSGSTWTRHLMGKMKPQMNMVMTSKHPTDLKDILSLLEKTGVKPHLNVKSFDEKGVTEGFEELKGRRTQGKIVFHIDD